MIEEVIIEIAKQTPSIGILIYGVSYFMKQVKKKDNQIISLAEKSIKAISSYQVHVESIDNIQRENQKDHHELSDLLKASYSILKDLKERR